MDKLLDCQLPVRVRDYRRRDLPYLIDIDVKGCDLPWLHEDWQRHLGLHVCYVARVLRNAGGFLVADCTFRPTAHVVKLVVDPMIRRMRVGSTLMNHFLRESAACGFTKITTTVPELLLDPRSEYDVSAFISQWFTPDGFVRDEFEINGEPTDGVMFETYL